MDTYAFVGEDQSTSNVVGVAFDYHEVVIESAMPAYNNADAASDQGTITVSDKVKGFYWCMFML